MRLTYGGVDGVLQLRSHTESAPAFREPRPRQPEVELAAEEVGRRFVPVEPVEQLVESLIDELVLAHDPSLVAPRVMGQTRSAIAARA